MKVRIKDDKRKELVEKVSSILPFPPVRVGLSTNSCVSTLSSIENVFGNESLIRGEVELVSS